MNDKKQSAMGPVQEEHFRQWIVETSVEAGRPASVYYNSTGKYMMVAWAGVVLMEMAKSI